MAVFFAIAIGFFVYAYVERTAVKAYWIPLGIGLGLIAGLATGLLLDARGGKGEEDA